MNKNDKDFMNQLSNLDDFSVEEIAENYPALYRNTKKRILKKCLKKDGFSAEIEDDGKEAITISGTERYKRRPWYRFAASAAAFVLAVGGITSVFMLNRNLNGNDISETEKTSVLSIHDSWSDNKSNKTTATAPNSDNIGSWDNTKSKEAANSKPISLSGTYWTDLNDDGSVTKALEFAEDSVSGDYIIMPENILTTDATKIPFTYEQNGYDITFSIGSDDTVMAKLSAADWRVMLTIEWQDGHTECFWTSDSKVLSSIQNISSGNGSFGYWVTNDNDTSQTPTTAKEPPVNNSNNSVPQTNTPTTPTQNNTPEPQKSFLNGLYYVEIAGVSGYCDDITRGIHGYMGFEFMPDGTLTKYFFDETGNAIGSTIVTTNYEIVENQFSYGDKAGTIVNPNDSTSFTVQFDDGDIFNFSTQQPIFRKYYFIETKPDTLNGTIWAKCFGDMDENYNYTDRRTIEFKEDGISGTVYILSRPRDVTKSTITEIPFTYERNGDEITFYMESSPYAMVKAEIACTPYDKICGLDVEYLEADEWGTTLWCFGQTGSLNDYHYNY